MSALRMPLAITRREIGDVEIALLTCERSHLAAAFGEWLRRYAEDPDAFGEDGGPDDGVEYADYLLELLGEQIEAMS